MTPGSETKVMQLADGRALAWIEVGEPTGTPVLAFHGAPDRAWEFAIYHAVAAGCGVRLIAVDRPGYGHSTYQPRRRLTGWPADIGQLADHLGLDRFGVIGHSAGGPHALACARFIPERLLGCGVLSGLAPQARTPITDGMLLSNRIQLAIYRHWPESVDGVAVGLWLLTKPLVAPLISYGRRHAEQEVDRTLRRMLPECDLAVVSRPEVRRTLVAGAAAFNSATLRASVQDMAIDMREWGFALGAIDTPVHIWHGDLDRNVPIAHADYLAEIIPDATLHHCPCEGHWLLVDHMPEVLTAVAVQHPSPSP